MFKDKKTKWTFFAFIFLFTLHITPATYINANFLSQFFKTQYVGLVYICAAIATICVILGLRDKLRKFGNYKVFITTLIIETCALALLLLTQSALTVFISLVTMFMSYGVSFICLDIFLEKHTKDDHTGRIRGVYLTAINSSFIIGPFIASLLLSNDNFNNVYLFIFILMFPVIILANELFRKFEDDPYDQIKIIIIKKKLITQSYQKI